MHRSNGAGSRKALQIICAVLFTTIMIPAVAYSQDAVSTGNAVPSATTPLVTQAESADATASSSNADKTAATEEHSGENAECSSAVTVTTATTNISSTTSVSQQSSVAQEATTSTSAAAEETDTLAASDADSPKALNAFEALTPQGVADIDLTLTTERTSYANGEYASFKAKYTMPYGKVKAGDTITVTVPDVLKNASIAYSPLHFSACNNLGNGTYELVFNDSAPEGLTGYFSVNAFATNTDTTNKTGTVTVGDKSVVISVSPTPDPGTPGTETRAIEKWAPDGTNYTQTTAVEGVYSEGAVVRFAFEADPRCSSMKNVVVTDSLPDELEFVEGSIVIERTTADKSSTITLDATEAAQIIKSSGQNLEFDFGDMDGTYYYRVYYKAKVAAGTNVTLTNTAHVNYDNGTVEASTFTLKPANGAGAAVGYKKVDKTVITDNPDDQTVTYTITFTNDNAFAVGDINLTDTLDSNVGYVTAYGSEYFTLTWDEAVHAVKITNSKEIPSSATQTITIVTDFSKVPVNTTVTNTVGGNTVKTKKTPAGKLGLTAEKTVDGNAPAADQTFSFTLTDTSTGKVLQTKQNSGKAITFDAIYYGKSDLGKIFTYQIAESDPGAGYTKDPAIYAVTVTPTLDGDSNIVATPTIVKNGAAVTAISFANTTVTRDLSVAKVWNDSDNQDGARPAFVTVRLLADGTDTGKTVTLDAGNGWKATFAGLAVYHAGARIAYTVTEDAVSGYSAAIASAGDAFTITNTHGTDTTSVNVTKVWSDSSDAFGLRPSSVTVHLLADGADTGKTVTLNADDNWTASFAGLAKNAGGKAIAYTVAEDSANNYAVAIVGSASAGYTLTNTLTTHNVTISKVDVADATELPGAKLSVIDAAGKTVDSWTSAAETHAVALPAGTYTLHEDMAPAGYDKAADIAFTVDAEGNVASAVAGAVAGTTVTMADKVTEKPDVPGGGKTTPSTSTSTTTPHGNTVTPSTSASVSTTASGTGAAHDSTTTLSTAFGVKTGDLPTVFIALTLLLASAVVTVALIGHRRRCNRDDL